MLHSIIFFTVMTLNTNSAVSAKPIPWMEQYRQQMKAEKIGNEKITGNWIYGHAVLYLIHHFPQQGLKLISMDEGKRIGQLQNLFRFTPSKGYLPVPFFEQLNRKKGFSSYELITLAQSAYRNNRQHHMALLLYFTALLYDAPLITNQKKYFIGNTSLYSTLFRVLTRPADIPFLIEFFNRYEKLFKEIKQCYIFLYLNLKGEDLERFLKGVKRNRINHIEPFRDLIEDRSKDGVKVYLYTNFIDGAIIWKGHRLEFLDKYRDKNEIPRFVTVLDLMIHMEKKVKGSYSEQIKVLRKHGAKTYDEMRKAGLIITEWERVMEGKRVE